MQKYVSDHSFPSIHKEKDQTYESQELPMNGCLKLWVQMKFPLFGLLFYKIGQE